MRSAHIRGNTGFPRAPESVLAIITSLVQTRNLLLHGEAAAGPVQLYVIDINHSFYLGTHPAL